MAHAPGYGPSSRGTNHPRATAMEEAPKARSRLCAPSGWNELLAPAARVWSHRMDREAWSEIFESRLPLLGHRNWVAVLDAAFPLFTSTGIEALYTGEDHQAVLSLVTDRISRAPHVAAAPLVAEELRWVESPMASAVLSALGEPRSMSHADILETLDEVSRRYRILALKTTCTTPYTSVFFELGCGYWSDEEEAELRRRMNPFGDERG